LWLGGEINFQALLNPEISISPQFIPLLPPRHTPRHLSCCDVPSDITPPILSASILAVYDGISDRPALSPPRVTHPPRCTPASRLTLRAGSVFRPYRRLPKPVAQLESLVSRGRSDLHILELSQQSLDLITAQYLHRGIITGELSSFRKLRDSDVQVCWKSNRWRDM
jgi:hypothetical protein